MRSLLVLLLIASVICTVAPAADKPVFDDDERTPTAAGGDDAGGGKALAKQTLAKVNSACFTLTTQYIVSVLGSYNVEENGEKVGTVSFSWNPYHGIVTKFKGKLAKARIADEDLAFMVKVAWSDGLFADYGFKSQTAVRDGENVVVSNKRENATGVTTVGPDNLPVRFAILGADGKVGIENELKLLQSGNQAYPKSMAVTAGPMKCRMELTYMREDGLPAVKRISLVAQRPGADPEPEVKFVVDSIKFMKIADTGKGLEQDRVEAFTILTVSMDLRKPEKERRLKAAQAMGKAGIHGTLVLSLLEQVAQSDEDDEVRAAAAASVKKLKALKAGGDTATAGTGTGTPGTGTGKAPPEPDPDVASTDPRFYGTWQGSFELKGIGHTEVITYTKDGKVRTILTNQFGNIVWDQRGTYQYDEGVLKMQIPARRTAPCRVRFVNDNTLRVTVAEGIELTYRRRQ